MSVLPFSGAAILRTLRAILPNRLLVFLNPYRELFAGQGVELPELGSTLPIPFDRIDEVILAASPDLPSSLTDALTCVVVLGTPEMTPAVITAAREGGVSLERWDAIALHATPEIPWHNRPEIALVTGGVEADVLDSGLSEIAASDQESVLAAYPRINFKQGIVQTFIDGFAHKPLSTFGTMNSNVLVRTQPGYHRPNYCDLIAANPLRG